MKTLYFGTSLVPKVAPSFALTVKGLKIQFEKQFKVSDFVIKKQGNGIVDVIMNVFIVTGSMKNDLIIGTDVTGTKLNLVMKEQEWKDFFKVIAQSPTLSTELKGSGFWE